MLAETENAIIAQIKTFAGQYVRRVESHPGNWSDVTLKHIAANLPGVFVVFDGGANDDSNADLLLNGEWVIYIAVNHANGHVARRQGDAVMIGAYQLFELIGPALQGWFPTDDAGGSLEFVRIRNAFTINLHNQGAAVYEVRFRQAMTIERSNTDALNKFITYAATHDLGGAFTAEDEVQLEQS